RLRPREDAYRAPYACGAGPPFRNGPAPDFGRGYLAVPPRPVSTRVGRYRSTTVRCVTVSVTVGTGTDVSDGFGSSAGGVDGCDGSTVGDGDAVGSSVASSVGVGVGVGHASARFTTSRH